MARRYLKAALWEYPLCVCCSAALAWTLFHGFYLPEALVKTPGPAAALALAVQAAFLLFGYSRRTAALGLCCWAAAIAGALLWARSAPVGVPLWLLLCAAPCAAVYLLSRSRAGCGVLFLLGALLYAAFAFLEYAVSPLPLLLFLWAGGCLAGCRAYHRSVVTGHAARTAFPAAFFTSAAACALALVLAAGTYGAVVRPLHPPTREFKLLTRLMSLEVLERLGVASQVHLFDENRLSQNTGREERISPDEGETPQRGPGEDTPEPSAPEEGDAPRRELGNGPDGAPANAVSYLPKPLLALLLPALAVLAAAAAVLLKRLSSRAWRRRLEGRPPEAQVTVLYAAMLRKLRRLGLPPAGPDTPFEYAARTGPQRARLLGRENGFDALSDAFVRVRYGALTPTPEDLRRCWTFYENFYPRCRRSLGNLRYARVFFFL